jgi:hypothetical protein
MKTPPAASIRLGASWHYRVVVMLFTTILIANYSISTSEKWPFFFQNGSTQDDQQWMASAALVVVSVLTAAWALWDAWAPRSGALHYAAGDWVLARGDVEVLGTLQPVIDLPDYVLVRFIPHANTSANTLSRDVTGDHLADTHPPLQLQLHNNQQQWLHLESRHTRHTSTALTAPALPATAHTAADLALGRAQWLAVRRAVHARPASLQELSAHEQA